MQLPISYSLKKTQNKLPPSPSSLRFGIFPSWGLSQKLPRLIGANRARELSLTAMPLDGMTAERWGLVSRVVPSKELLPLAKEIGGRIARNHGEMVRRYKAVLNEGLDLSLGDGRKLEKVRFCFFCFFFFFYFFA